MNSIFLYTGNGKDNGWLEERPEMEMPTITPEQLGINEGFIHFEKMEKYRNHIASLRRFRYNYPCDKKEMIEGKDFEVKTERIANLYTDHYQTVAIPLTPPARTYTQQEAEGDPYEDV